jgi:hypothetical protein
MPAMSRDGCLLVVGREMAFENLLKEACRMISQKLPLPSPSPEGCLRGLYQQMMDSRCFAQGRECFVHQPKERV